MVQCQRRRILNDWISNFIAPAFEYVFIFQEFMVIDIFISFDFVIREAESIQAAAKSILMVAIVNH